MLGYYAITKPSLKRKTPVEVDAISVSEARKELAAKASKILSYTALAQAIPNVESLATARTKVAQVFKELDFKPLSWESVVAYKAWFVRKNSKDAAFSSMRVSWCATPLSSYSAAVPEFVLSKAIELKGKLPEATFTVEYPYYEKVFNDPFLRMDYKGLSYYIDVWDEPKFEGRRTV